jgi:ribosomal protein S18 acetylase RimI-like enzyme
MNILIKNAEIQNANEISALTNELGYPANESQTKERLSLMLSSHNYSIFVATNIDGILCGWVVVEKRLSLETGFKAEISGLVTGSKFRRLGIGKKLVLACESWAIQNCLEKIVVASNSQRHESHIFYKSIGFLLKKTSHKYEKVVK